jgi:4a-hydroxytetrahydrobiopterin dehydratase
MDPKFSPGTDEAQSMKEVEALLNANWKLDIEQMGLEKTYYFKAYTKCVVREFPSGSRGFI